MIDEEGQLSEFIAQLRRAEWLVLDTEADSLHAYPEKLCLLQFGLPGRLELVDPLAGLNLDPLFQALQKRELVMHGSDYDVRLLRAGHGFVPDTVFDTMLAARLTGHEKFGLADLVREHLGVELEKGSQRANWAKRPLTDKMVTYALNDVRYLEPLSQRLRAQLDKAGRREWHRQECARMVEENSQPASPDPERVWRLKGSSKLPSLSLAVLRELWHWREAEALRRCRPPFFVLSHDLMVRLAMAAGNGDDWQELVPRRLSDNRRRTLIDAIRRGRDLPATEHPRPLKPPPRKSISMAQKRKMEALQRTRDQRAEKLKLDPTLIASRAELVGLAVDADENASLMLPWQLEQLGI
mgnify:CR=1 FL=1